jgi:preprotein translocase subunit SecE
VAEERSSRSDTSQERKTTGQKAMKSAAEARKMDKAESQGADQPNWAQRTLGQVWGPVAGKARDLKTFFSEVRTELKKVTWPARPEVYATTIVVILTTIFFGFYLYGLDLLMTQLFTRILHTAP